MATDSSQRNYTVRKALTLNININSDQKDTLNNKRYGKNTNNTITEN